MRVTPPVSGKDPFDGGAVEAEAYKSIPLERNCDECIALESRRIRAQKTGLVDVLAYNNLWGI